MERNEKNKETYFKSCSGVDELEMTSDSRSLGSVVEKKTTIQKGERGQGYGDQGFWCNVMPRHEL